VPKQVQKHEKPEEVNPFMVLGKAIIVKPDNKIYKVISKDTNVKIEATPP